MHCHPNQNTFVLAHGLDIFCKIVQILGWYPAQWKLRSDRWFRTNKWHLPKGGRRSWNEPPSICITCTKSSICITCTKSLVFQKPNHASILKKDHSAVRYRPYPKQWYSNILKRFAQNFICVYIKKWHVIILQHKIAIWWDAHLATYLGLCSKLPHQHWSCSSRNVRSTLSYRVLDKIFVQLRQPECCQNEPPHSVWYLMILD